MLKLCCMNKEFIRVRSFKDVALALALILSGLFCMWFVESDGINILGFFCLLTGFLFLFLLKTDYKDNDTGIRYSKTEHYFAQSLKDEIIDQLKRNPHKIPYNAEDKGNGLRLDIYTDNKGTAYYQLFEYIPHRYKPCTEVFKTE